MRKIQSLTADGLGLIALASDGTLWRFGNGWTQLDVPMLPQPDSSHLSLFDDVDPRADTELIAKDECPFDDFWELYAYKVARQNAEKAWKKMKAADKRLAMEAVPAYVSRTTTDPNARQTMRAHAATWLNACRWLDEDTTRVVARQDSDEVLL